jgi:hypothetical protein
MTPLAAGRWKLVASSMADHDEIYGKARADRLEELLRFIAQRITELDQSGQLLAEAPELIRLFGEARQTFSYEVRSTYDTPELSEHRRLVDEALQSPELFPDDDDDEPWRNPPR